MTDTFQWQRCAADGTGCADIAGETNASYLVAAADVGLQLRATGARDGVTATPKLSGIIGGAGDWAAAIAYTLTRPAFTPTRDVPVATASQLVAAINDLRAGDLIHATAAFDLTQEFTISGKLLASTARIDLTTANVRFRGYPLSSTGGLTAPGMPALYFIGNRNIQMYVGDMTNPGGAGAVDFYHSDHCLLYVQSVHDTGGDGISLVSNAGPIDSCDIYIASCSNWETDISGDPHAEKGTGGHGCQFGDGSKAVTNTRFAMWAHDGPHGSALQYGASSGNITGNTIYLKAERLTMVSISQRAGNGINLWGANPVSGDFKYLEVNDAEGYAVSVDNEYSANFSTCVFDHARSSNTRINPAWRSEATFNPGPTYLDASGT